MSTKNLARTVIEGGRYYGNAFDRRASHGAERTHVRQALRGVRDDDDAERVLLAPRRKVPRWFHDKLAAAERWLRAQVGRPWDKVRGELFAQFDTRTTAGRHIVFDHMLRSVRTEALATWWSRPILEVGRGGILRKASRPPRTRRVFDWPRPAWLDWLGDRKIAVRGAVLFWLEPTEHERFRQGRRLTDAEADHWNALPSAFRAQHGRRM